MTDLFKLPSRGFVFWPVGNGDSTTVVVDDGVVLQVDLHNMECADIDDHGAHPIVDELVRTLPRVGGRPYLSTFALTHPDDDHCCGFGELMKRVTIGELWFTPRIFLEQQKDLCDDACVFQTEALRRVKATIAAGGQARSGDRIRIVGRDQVLQESTYQGFPRALLTIPGNAISELDGRNLAGRFRAVVHAPFKDDVGSERNDSSLGLQISLLDGGAKGNALLLGDLCYPAMKRIFDISQPDDLRWNLFLAPHHCSKSVMYWQDEGDSAEVLKQALLDQIESAAVGPANIIASSDVIPLANKPGDNPPHAKAKARYEEIAPDGFYCTMEHPDPKNTAPITFEMTPSGLRYVAPAGISRSRESSLLGAVGTARGSAEPPGDRVGFGTSTR